MGTLVLTLLIANVPHHHQRCKGVSRPCFTVHSSKWSNTADNFSNLSYFGSMSMSMSTLLSYCCCYFGYKPDTTITPAALESPPPDYNECVTNPLSLSPKRSDPGNANVGTKENIEICMFCILQKLHLQLTLSCRRTFSTFEQRISQFSGSVELPDLNSSSWPSIQINRITN